MNKFVVVCIIVLQVLSATALVWMYLDAEKQKEIIAQDRRNSEIHLIDTLTYISNAREAIIQKRIDSIDSPKMKSLVRLKKEEKQIQDERTIDGSTSASMPRF